MIIDDILKAPSSWLSKDGDTGIVISTRIRLARNIAGHRFPRWADEKERIRIARDLRNAFDKTETITPPVFLDMMETDIIDRSILEERHLISRDFAEKGAGSVLVLSGNESICAMINEEDHLRLQAIRFGLALDTTYKELIALDAKLEKHVKYAFSSELGYLTACPSNVGTGLRASVMMHLSGLRLLDEVDPLIRGLNRLGIAVRGLAGEGTEAHGNMFQISNQGTLGETEDEIIAGLTDVVEELVMHENNARARLMQDRNVFVLDQVGRALGILSCSHMLGSDETVDLLSGLRFGIELGIVKDLSTKDINELIIMTQPGHLQKYAGKNLSPEKRDELRSTIIRDRISNVKLTTGQRDQSATCEGVRKD